MTTNGTYTTGTASQSPQQCCPPSGTQTNGTGSSYGSDAADGVHSSVRNYYSKVLQTSSDLKTNACCVAGKPSSRMQQLLQQIPEPVIAKFYGCGFPALHDLNGLTALDLGCGAGRDCYILAALTGEQGKVIGIDMTTEQLEVAAQHAQEYCTQQLKYSQSNMEFKHGYIEDLTGAGIKPSSIDFITSNCVINLSPDKPAVLRSMWTVLKHGGEVYFSDVYADRRIPADLRQHPVLYGECLSGALYQQDFNRICLDVGFVDPRVIDCKPIEVTDPELLQLVGNIQFYSITYRLFKFDRNSPEALEHTPCCEQYGQFAVYNGTIKGNEHHYALDQSHSFQAHLPVPVCGNTASMLASSITLAPHFTVIGDRSRHFGVFDCSPPATKTATVAGTQPPAPGCC